MELVCSLYVLYSSQQLQSTDVAAKHFTFTAAGILSGIDNTLTSAVDPI
jgi:hypothetical protein